MEHIIKIEERYLQRIRDKLKTCELRYNDRDYQVGDTIKFMTLISDEDYHYHEDVYEITHVLNISSVINCNSDKWDEEKLNKWVVLSIKEKKTN